MSGNKIDNAECFALQKNLKRKKKEQEQEDESQSTQEEADKHKAKDSKEAAQDGRSAQLQLIIILTDNRRKKYTDEEDQVIADYVTKRQNRSPSGNSLWKEMEQKKVAQEFVSECILMCI